jgi:HSF-type DNA-binding
MRERISTPHRFHFKIFNYISDLSHVIFLVVEVLKNANLEAACEVQVPEPHTYESNKCELPFVPLQSASLSWILSAWFVSNSCFSTSWLFRCQYRKRKVSIYVLLFAIMIGIGIDLDLTTAAVKAVRDAMDRNACFADYDSSLAKQNHRLHIQLGVPSSKPIGLYPQNASSETSVVSPRHDFDKGIIVPNGRANCSDEAVGGVNVMYILQQLFPRTYGHLLQPVVHLEVGGLHVPATSLDQNNRIVENYAFPSRPETYVVIASLLFLTFQCPEEQLLHCYAHPFITNTFGVLDHPLQRTAVLDDLLAASQKHDSSCSQRDKSLTTEAVASSRLHGFHLSTRIEPSNDFSAYSRSFQNPILIKKDVGRPDEERPTLKEQQRKQNSFTSFDVLAHISAAMMNERRQSSDDSGVVEDSSALKSTDENEILQGGMSRGDDSRTMQYNNHSSPKNYVRHFVRHSYRDFSQDVPPHGDHREKNTLATSNSAFPIKLHETLTQIANDGFDHVIGWLSHGRSFKIYRNYEFVEVVLPQYFVMTKKSSFLRQLNLYGFRRISDGSYYHERFLRGMKFLCYPMQRQKVNGNGSRAAGNPNEEPNFSKYPSCPPQPPSIANSKSLPPSSQVKNNIGNDCSRVVERLESRIVPLSKPPLTQQVQDIIKKEKLQFIYESYSSGEDNQAAQSGHSHEESNGETVSIDSSTSSTANRDGKEVPTSGRNDQLASRVQLRGHRRRQVSFPLKLQRILDQLERDGQDDVMSWLPHGRAFIVHDVERFVEEILPLHFNQTKYSSFQRQCHMYHMLRITNGADKGAYYHHQFQRGRSDLAITMTRTRINGNGTRQASNPNLEPNLYILPPLPSMR